MSARITVLLLALALGLVPATAHAHGGEDDHRQTDSVVIDPVDEQQSIQNTREKDAAAATKAKQQAALTGNEHVTGEWGPVTNWPVVAIHTALLADGRVLTYDSVRDTPSETYDDHNTTRATIWDPQTGSFTPATVTTGFNIFCSGLAHLADGTLFLAGGNKNRNLDGIRQTHTFNHVTGAWSLDANMQAERWYPSVTPLANGEMLITDGLYTSTDTPEVRTTSGGMRRLTNAAIDLSLYPWIDVAPDGRAFQSGPETTMRSLNTSGNGQWTTHGSRDGVNRDYGSRALYDVGKILVSGGSNSRSDAKVIDINGSSPSVSNTGSMANGRRQHNLTVLADGSVMANGGNRTGAGLIDLNGGVYAAERWNPATGQWTTMASEQVTRQYHATTQLLLDGRVLSAGGGICGDCQRVGYIARDGQVFTPPYLFKKDGSGQLATRPTISSAPAEVGYGNAFDVQTPQAASISKVSLNRVSSVTHSVNMEQRYIPMTFTASSGKVRATAPANANIAPPGLYMLTVVDDQGVPSVSKMVLIKSLANVAPTTSITSPAQGARFTAPATVTIDAVADDADGSVAKVEFYRGATLIATDTTAPFSATASSLAAGSYALTTRAYDNRNATTTSTTVTIAVDAPNVLPTVSLTSPANGATATAPGSFSLAATAADSDGTIARVEFYRGATLISSDTSSPYTATVSGLATGSYALTAKAVDNRGGERTSTAVNVTVTDPPNTLPTVSLTSPANGATTTAPGAFSLAATAADSDGTIDRVEFYRGSTLISSDASSPYTAAVTGLATGSYALTAKAVDNRGGERTSAAVNVTVTDPPNTLPTVSLTSPANGATATAPGSFSLAATAADSDGTVDRVEFYRGATLISTDTSSPYTATVSGLATGSYALTAKAVDNRGGERTSTAVNVTVTDPPNQAPTVSLTAPTAGATYTAPATLGYTATAADSDGTVAKVEFLRGGNVVATDTSAPYEASESGVAAGTYALSARATDDKGATRTTGDTTVTVTAPPTGGGSGPIAAYAMDETSGTVARDVTGNGHDGVLRGGVWSTAGRHGGALSFDGVDDWVTIPDDDRLDLTNAMTLTAWVNIRTATRFASLLQKEAPSRGSFSYAMYASNGAAVTGSSFWVGDQGVYPQPNLPVGRWVHVALTYGGGTLRTYFDGQLGVTRTGIPAMIGSEGPLRLGGSGIWAGEHLDGLMDDVRVYDRALSAAEVTTVKDTPLVVGDRPVLELSFDEGTGTVARDSSGRGHDGSLRGPEWTAAGRRGGALDFDGGTDWVEVPDHADLDATTALTMEAWIRPRTLKAWQNVFFKEAPGGAAYGLWATGGGTAQPNGWVGDAGVYSFGAVTAANRWTHLAYTLKDGVGRLYADGVEVGYGTNVPPAAVTAGVLHIGGNSVWPSEGFNGLIDEVRIWRRALTPQELAARVASASAARKSTASTRATKKKSAKRLRACRRPGSKPKAYKGVTLKACKDKPHRVRKTSGRKRV